MSRQEILNSYQESYGHREVEFYQWGKIKPKCTMAALVLGLWLEDQEGEFSEVEQWIGNCCSLGLFKVENKDANTEWV